MPNFGLIAIWELSGANMIFYASQMVLFLFIYLFILPFSTTKMGMCFATGC